MNKDSSLTPAVIAFIVVVAMVGGYVYMQSAGSTAPPLTASSTASSTAGQFEQTAGQLSSISFSVSLFSDPRFTVLQDITTPITQEPIGRTNPFAPL
ncbi:MAG: hypothetical protein B7X04_01765 [Parcubacteria group bacterium 21-54-25]|nr:MAG: hypothetical protein B7X04_01765 [Parcubacteria group bacterium 21-54-25]HQU07697.1 hypothetical protein [Candidatus Paceibacterota bacterium]